MCQDLWTHSSCISPFQSKILWLCGEWQQLGDLEKWKKGSITKSWSHLGVGCLFWLSSEHQSGSLGHSVWGIGTWRKTRSFYDFPLFWPLPPEFFLREEALTSQLVKHDTLVSMCRTRRGRWEINVSALEFLIRSPVNSVMSPWEHIHYSAAVWAWSWEHIRFWTPRRSLRYSLMSHLVLIRPWESICL